MTVYSYGVGEPEFLYRPYLRICDCGVAAACSGTGFVCLGWPAECSSFCVLAIIEEVCCSEFMLTIFLVQHHAR